MRSSHCLPALALLLFLPASADDGPATQAPAQADVKKNQEQMSCCAGEEKVKCPRAKAATSSKKHAAKTAPAAEATAKPSAPGAANMVVTRDPETGELRNATPEEREKLLGRRPQVAPAAPRVVILPDGTEMVELGEENMSYAVVRRNPDGTLTRTCVEGPEAASAARKPKTATPAPRPEER